MNGLRDMVVKGLVVNHGEYHKNKVHSNVNGNRNGAGLQFGWIKRYMQQKPLNGCKHKL